MHEIPIPEARVLARGAKHVLRLGRGQSYVKIEDDHVVRVDEGGRELGTRFDFARFENGSIEIGRALAPDRGLALLEKDVSRRHARVWRSGAELAVEDLGSANGSFLVGLPPSCYLTLAAEEVDGLRRRASFDYRGYAVFGSFHDPRSPRLFVDEAEVRFPQGRILLAGMPKPHQCEALRDPSDVASYRVVVYYRHSRPGTDLDRTIDAIQEWAENLFQHPGQGPLEGREIRFEYYPQPPNPHLPSIRDRETASKLLQYLYRELAGGREFAPTIQEGARRLRAGFR